MPPYTSKNTQDAYTAAKQAIADGEMVFVCRLRWTTSGFFSHEFEWLPEQGAMIQAVESVGWQLDRLDSTTDSSGLNAIVAMFRRDMR